MLCCIVKSRGGGGGCTRVHLGRDDGREGNKMIPKKIFVKNMGSKDLNPAIT